MEETIKVYQRCAPKMIAARPATFSKSSFRSQKFVGEFKNLQSIMNRIKDIYKEHATIPKKELADVLKHDLWWDKETCIKYGLIDEVWNK